MWWIIFGLVLLYVLLALAGCLDRGCAASKGAQTRESKHEARVDGAGAGGAGGGGRGGVESPYGRCGAPTAADGKPQPSAEHRTDSEFSFFDDVED
jgi:hypothetical protein